MDKTNLEILAGLLDEAIEAKTMKSRATFIQCAQIIVEKYLDGESIETVQDVPKPKKKVSQEYEVRVDAKKLVKIVDKNGDEASLDLPMKIDGVETTYGEAIGKPFVSGSFL